MGALKLVGLGFAAALVLVFGIGSLQERSAEQAATDRAAQLAAMTPAQRAAESASAAAAEEARLERERQFQRGVLIAKALRQSMKNPAAFQLERALLMPDKTWCLEFRSTNSFNAVVPGQLSAPPGGRALTLDMSGGPAQWNRVCAGRTGDDLSYMRHAL